MTTSGAVGGIVAGTFTTGGQYRVGSDRTVQSGFLKVRKLADETLQPLYQESEGGGLVW